MMKSIIPGQTLDECMETLREHLAKGPFKFSVTTDDGIVLQEEITTRLAGDNPIRHESPRNLFDRLMVEMTEGAVDWRLPTLRNDEEMYPTMTVQHENGTTVILICGYDDTDGFTTARFTIE